MINIKPIALRLAQISVILVILNAIGLSSYGRQIDKMYFIAQTMMPEMILTTNTELVRAFVIMSVKISIIQTLKIMLLNYIITIFICTDRYKQTV